MAKVIEEVLSGEKKPALPKADTTVMEAELKEQLSAAKEQSAAQIDRGVAENVLALQKAEQQAQESFDAQRDRIDVEEAMGKDAQVLYAQMRGDQGGIGAAQYDSIANTAAENRLAVAQAQRKLASDTAQQMAQLRARGEYEKAEKVLELTQEYLGRLTELRQWAAEYDMSAAKFAESVAQWQQEYDQKQSQLNAQQSQWQAEFDYDTRQKDLSEAGKAMLEAGVMPSESQLAAMAMTAGQAKDYMAAAKVKQAGKGASSAAAGTLNVKQSAAAQKEGGEYALYLAARESGGDPRTYVKNHYKEYGLTALPGEKAYQTWEKNLEKALDADGFALFLRKLNSSLSEDTKAAADYLTAKHWPTLSVQQRKEVDALYKNYGKSYRYGS